MLQGLRDNLKGAVAIFVVVIFVVPLILFGVEQLFVGSVGGDDVATVGGVGISRRDLQRELVLEKQRLQQQFNLEANSPQLEDSALTGPVLDRMVKRLALFQAAQDAGMGASKELLWKQIAGIDAFKVDGKFSESVFKERISFAYTPATFLEASAQDFILGHLNSGVETSGFVTPADLKTLAAITRQKRTFFTITIPKSKAADVEVSDAEIESFYGDNPAQFTDPETVKIEYLELTLDALAEAAVVSDEEVKAAYDEEVANFQSDPKLSIAHILIEGDKQDVIQEVSTKLAAGDDFSELAKKYSDDLGSKNQGGNLGVLTDDAFPEAFVTAAKALSVGSTSAPVKTDAGTHFIKLLENTNVTPPTFDERKDMIKGQLARQKAQDVYIEKMTKLEETTFGADSLAPAAEVLGLQVQTSPAFSRQGGGGIAQSSEVVEAAFAEDVLKQGYNSKVLELDGDRAVVIRLLESIPERVRPLADVKENIRTELRDKKQAESLAQQASELRAKISSGGSADTLAEEASYEYKFHDGVDRMTAGVNNVVLQKVFSMPRPDASAVIDQVALPDGGVSVIGLQTVQDGSVDGLEPEQLAGLKRQLAFQYNQAEMHSFENAIIEKVTTETN
jgi:peptidyl-prolyl cis-trans isomerase D